MTHSSSLDDACSSRWIDGRAMFTIVTSSKIMPCAMHIASRVSRLCHVEFFPGPV